jgi:Mitochondrial carrier protein
MEEPSKKLHSARQIESLPSDRSHNASPADTPSVTLTTVPNVQYPAWHAAVAGGLAGFGSRMTTAPLDLIRIRRQLGATPIYPSESLWSTWQHIVATEGGIAALYRGNMAAMYLWIGYAAVQFSVYDATKKCLKERLGTTNTVSAFGAGAWAGVCATLATYPFDVCRTTFSARGLVTATALQPLNTPLRHKSPRLPPFLATPKIPPPPATALPLSSLIEPQGFPITHMPLHVTQPPPTSASQQQHHHHPRLSQHSASPTPGVPATTITVTNYTKRVEASPLPRTLLDFARQLFRQKGIGGFYAGSGPAVMQIIPYMGLNFALYDWLTSENTTTASPITTTSSSTTIGSAAYAGSLSGALSKMCVYPLDTVKRRLQAQAFFAPPFGHDTYRGMWDCIVSIHEREGIKAFYRGMVPSVLKTAISTSLTFALFRWTMNTLQGIHDFTTLQR